MSVDEVCVFFLFFFNLLMFSVWLWSELKLMEKHTCT